MVDAPFEEKRLRFSGHESFCCRYGWMPKLVHAVVENPELFVDDEAAMLDLGLGRNMVRSIRFWAEAFGLVTWAKNGQCKLTSFGHKLMHPETGSDPYLEDHASLWLLHWKLTIGGRLGAWSVAFNQTSEPEIDRDQFDQIIVGRANEVSKGVSPNTIRLHSDIFLRTYVGGNIGAKIDGGPEESLGSPLQELGLLDVVERTGRAIIRFNRGHKNTLSKRAFGIALAEFWSSTAPNSKTMPLLSIGADHNSPGRVFKLTLSASASLAKAFSDEFGEYVSFKDDTVRSGLILADGASPSNLINVAASA